MGTRAMGQRAVDPQKQTLLLEQLQPLALSQCPSSPPVPPQGEWTVCRAELPARQGYLVPWHAMGLEEEAERVSGPSPAVICIPLPLPFPGMAPWK